MGFKFGSTASGFSFGSTEYVPAAGGEFAITDYPPAVRRGEPFLVLCDNLQQPSAVSLNGRAIEVESVSEETGELELLAPEGFDGKHGPGQTISITVDGVTRTFTAAFNPPAGWKYVDFVDPTNDPEFAAFYNLLDENGDPTIVETGDQGVYEGETPDGKEVVVDPDNTVAVDVDGQPPSGTAIGAYVITDDGRGIEGDLVFKSLTEVEPEAKAVVRLDDVLGYYDENGDLITLQEETLVRFVVFSGEDGVASGERILVSVVEIGADGTIPDIELSDPDHIGNTVTVAFILDGRILQVESTVIDGNE